MVDAQSLGQRVKALREKKGWRQEELAKAAGLTQPAVSRIELGHVQQPRLLVLKRLSEALGVSVDYLIWGAYRNKESQHPDSFLLADGFAQVYGSLADSSRKQVYQYAKFLKEQELERKGRTKERQ